MSSQAVESGSAVPKHRIPGALIEQVFAGPVDASAMRVLRDGQYSRRLLLLKVLHDLGQSSPPVRPAVEEAWPILVAAEKHAPEVVREILLYPSVGTWLVRIVRKIRAIIDDDVPIRVDMAYLGSIAAAAAIRAGIEATVTAQSWGGRITLPTVGQFEVADGGTPDVTRVRTSGSAAFLEQVDGSWIPLDEARSLPFRSHRSTAGGRSMSWTFDDIDPYRSFAGMAANDRLGAAEFETWCGKLDRAWAILVREHADYLPELSAANPVIVPAPRVNGFVAASSAASFGAIRAALPDTPADMAETLLHELQHSKLNALLDLVPLQRPVADRLCYAPWRKDPRPLSGLLHGIYAFVGVTEYWYRQWSSQPDATTAFQFVHHQEQVRAAVQALGPTPELTPEGNRFLEVARDRLSACDDATVPEDVLALVTTLLAVNRIAWRLKHLVPCDEHQTRLVELWFADGRCPVEHAESTIEAFHRPDPKSSLAALLTPGSQVADRDIRPGEKELVDGDLAEARSRFGARIRTNPEDDGAWVGLLTAMGSYGGKEDPPPEIMAATYRRIAAVRDGIPPDPTRLVDWFARG
jgi:HEXXH motif-containing protein